MMRHVRGLLLVSLGFVVASSAQAQVPAVGPTKCVGNCGSRSSSGSARSVAPGRVEPAGLSPAELELQRKRSFGFQQNELGVAAYNKGDWEAAVRYFKNALENRPNDPVIAENLRWAELNLRVAQEQARLREEHSRRQVREAASARELRESIDRVARTLGQATDTSDFDGRRGGTAASTGLEFARPGAAGRRAAGKKAGADDCGPVTDSSVVNLCRAKGKTVDPRTLKGRASAPSTPEPGLQFMRARSGKVTAAPDDANAIGPFAHRSRTEQDLSEQIQSRWHRADELLRKAFEASQAGDKPAAKRAANRAVALTKEAATLKARLDAVQDQRLKAGMKVLLAQPRFAAAWKEAVARIRKREVAAFATANAEEKLARAKVTDQLQRGPADANAAREAAEISDRLRAAQVEAMRQATEELRQAALSLLEAASTGAAPTSAP
jgi:hypothetical protein